MVRIVQITDLHVDLQERFPHGIDVWAQLKWALEATVAAVPDLVVVTGDLALQSGDRATYLRLKELFLQLPSDVLLLPGNHDDRSLFGPVFGRRYVATAEHPWLDRQVEAGGTPMLLLDTADGSVTQRQVSWVDAVLSTRAAAAERGDGPRRMIVWAHHPVVTGFHRHMDQNYRLEGADDLLRSLSRYTERMEVLLFCGHYHCEHAIREQGIHQFCTPSTYMQLDPVSDRFRVTDDGPGVRIIDVPNVGVVESVVVYGNREVTG